MRKLNSTELILLFLYATLAGAFAQGTAFTYQGRLADNGTAANGTYEFRFALFDALSSGTQVGTPVTNTAIAVSSGNFTATLDFGAGAFPGAGRWLQIGVRTNGSGGAFTTLNPRQPVTSTPYALTASDVTGANIARLNPPNTAVQATGTPVITSGFITSANVVNGGSSYMTPPLVTVNDATGAGAVIIANISSGSVVSFTVQNPGSGYSAGTTLTVAPPPSNASQTFAGLNYFGGVNLLTNTGNVVAGNGSGLNNLNASGLNAGTVADARLSANVALLNRTQTFSGTNTFADPANNFTGNGAGLTGLNAASLTGTISDARLSANVARLNANQAFTGVVQFTNSANVVSGNGSGLSNLNLTANSAGTIRPGGGFVLSSTLSIGGTPEFVIVTDVNGDGRADLVSDADSNLKVHTNDGFGGLVLASSPPGISGGNGNPIVVAADMNGDGRVDLLGPLYFVNRIDILTNAGGGNFAFATSLTVNGVIAVAAGDVNGDGRMDVIGANRNSGTLTVLTNNGSGNFILSSTPAVGQRPLSVVTGDFNGDGRIDLAAGCNLDSKVVVLTNNGSGGFAQSSMFFTSVNHLNATDLNGDGRADLIATDFGGSLAVATNNGSAGFGPPVVLTISGAVGVVVVVDVNADGRTDIVVADNCCNLVLFTNQANISFTLAGKLPVGDGPLSAAAGDLNGDGHVDLVSGNSIAGTVSILLNRNQFIGTFSGSGAGLTGISRLDAPDGNPAPALSVDNNGRIAIGTNVANHRLRISGGPPWTSSGWAGAVELDNASAIAWNANASGNRFGIGQLNGGLVFFASGSDPGNTASPANYVMTIDDNANVGINTTTPTARLQIVGEAKATVFTTTSDKNEKENFAAVSPQQILAKIIALPIVEWNFKEIPCARHIGPVAQDFHAAFSLNGADDKHIATVDADGVALAAIQGLNQKLEQELKRREAENTELRKRLTALEQLIKSLPGKFSEGER